MKNSWITESIAEKKFFNFWLLRKVKELKFPKVSLLFQKYVRKWAFLKKGYKIEFVIETYKKSYTG